MEFEKKSIFRVRWGFKLGLVLLFGLLAIAVVLYAVRWYWTEDFGIVVPTKDYAHLVRSQIYLDVYEWSVNTSAIMKWRHTGVWDDSARFPSAALFWFVYDSTHSKITINPFKESISVSPELLSSLQEQILAQFDSTMQSKRKGRRNESFVINKRRYHLNANLFEDEPRFIGMIMDMDHFRDVDLPTIFNRAYETYPMLRLFAFEPEKEGERKSEDYFSNFFVAAKDADGKIIAKIGVPGKYADPKNYDKITYSTDIDYIEMFGFSMHFVIPRCQEIMYQWIMSRAFFLLIAVWIITLLFWIFAELKRIKMSKSMNN